MMASTPLGTVTFVNAGNARSSSDTTASVAAFFLGFIVVPLESIRLDRAKRNDYPRSSTRGALDVGQSSDGRGHRVEEPCAIRFTHSRRSRRGDGHQGRDWD